MQKVKLQTFMADLDVAFSVAQSMLYQSLKCLLLWLHELTAVWHATSRNMRYRNSEDFAESGSFTRLNMRETDYCMKHETCAEGTVMILLCTLPAVHMDTALPARILSDFQHAFAPGL